MQFGRIADLVRDLLDVPVAIVSIVSDTKQVFAGHRGLPAEWAALGGTPLSHSFCQHVVDQNAPLMVSDARQEVLLFQNLAIQDLDVIAYLGVPLHLPSGEVIGAVAAISSEPRVWSSSDLERLVRVSAIADTEIAVRVSELKWRSLFEDMQEGFFIGEAVRDEAGRMFDWRYHDINPAFGALTGLATAGSEGKTYRELVPDGDPTIIDTFATVLETGQPVVFEIFLGALGDRWFEGRARALDANRFATVFSNITARKQQELQEIERRQLLNRELSHRLKNTLSVVGAIVSQTLRNASELVTARTTAMDRIKALATAHDLLISGHNDAGTIRAMIEAAVAVHDDGSRLEVSGPAIPIGSDAALALSLVIHELATNACKYGALSVPEGRVEIRWSMIKDPDTDKPLLAFSWAEYNGPPVSPPGSPGFGTQLIEMGFSGSSQARSELDYRAEGLRCRIITPLDELMADSKR
jgi:two-component sensor histidine kinase/PAS domain-containing protein